MTREDRLRIVDFLADVAELADAQVSEACDGDIVEVQVLSSAPKIKRGESHGLALFLGIEYLTHQVPGPSQVPAGAAEQRM